MPRADAGVTTVGSFRHHHHETLGSTMDEALSRLRAGEPGGFVVSAAEQSGGRGRRGRHWISPRGNLYASFAFRDPAPAAVLPQLGFVGGVAVARALRGRAGGDGRITLKWPNDVLHDGAKLAGLLLEATALPGGGLGCVMGIGVNCQSSPEGLAYPTTSLQQVGDTLPDPQAVLGAIAPHIEQWFDCWAASAGFPAVRAAWLDMAAGVGDPVTVVLARSAVRGTFVGLDEGGRLLLDTAAGRETVDAGDVVLAEAAMDATR